jgi:uncharacterized membrane protein YeiH
VLRDVLLNEIPQVLRREIYAIAALLGATLVVIGTRLGISPVAVTLVAAAVVAGLRIVALWRGWNAPVPRS